MGTGSASGNSQNLQISGSRCFLSELDVGSLNAIRRDQSILWLGPGGHLMITNT